MGINRRDFLKSLGGAALLTIVPRNVLGGSGFIAPSDQLTKGIIGTGGIGRSSYHFTSNDACRLVALCDVDNNHLTQAQNMAKQRFGQECATYHYYRDQKGEEEDMDTAAPKEIKGENRDSKCISDHYAIQAWVTLK